MYFFVGGKQHCWVIKAFSRNTSRFTCELKKHVLSERVFLSPDHMNPLPYIVYDEHVRPLQFAHTRKSALTVHWVLLHPLGIRRPPKNNSAVLTNHIKVGDQLTNHDREFLSTLLSQLGCRAHRKSPRRVGQRRSYLTASQASPVTDLQRRSIIASSPQRKQRPKGFHNRVAFKADAKLANAFTS